MKYTYEEVLEAYTKLRTYIYYDSSNLYMRISLAEFETGLTEDENFLNRYIEYGVFEENYNVVIPEGLELYERKLHVFTSALNNHHTNPEFFDRFVSRIKSKLLPKKIENNLQVDNSIITNKRTQSEYNVERSTLFIDAPIEIHIVSVLWIMRSGIDIDKNLSDFCFGNRLILNKKKEAIVQGSGLFKPYPRQYQKWRDVAIKSARDLLNQGHDVAILNLDIRDFFYSCRIPISNFSSPYTTSDGEFNLLNNLYNIFKEIHINFTSLVHSKSIPYDFSTEIKDEKNNTIKVILPIGLLSSFVLANQHLSKFDERIQSKIQPSSYGRYVDDILIVFSNPKVKDKRRWDDEIPEINFDFAKYKKWLQNSDYEESEKSFTTESNITDLELFVLEQLHPIINLIDSPVHLQQSPTQNNRVFKLHTYERLYCQSEKTILYYFDKDETSLVIDKLKRDLEEKSSEFRNYDDSEKEDDFEESAYHLLYDGSEGKIRTLKDYKERRPLRPFSIPVKANI
jgi:hypothetical protein